MTDFTPNPPTPPPPHRTHFRGVLAAPQPWQALWHYREVDSTQQSAAQLIDEGFDLRGCALWSDLQHAGRGRGDRAWSSPSGGLYVSAVLPGDAQLPPSAAGWLPLAAALAAVEVLRARFALGARIKWPNDILIGDAKLAGVIGEFRPLPGTSRSVAIVGLGINWMNSVAPEALTLGWQATSVQVHAPRVVLSERLPFLHAWLTRLAQLHGRLTEDPISGGAAIAQAAEELLWRRGERIKLDRTEAGPVEGILVGLGAMGAARLRVNGQQPSHEIEIHCGEPQPSH